MGARRGGPLGALLAFSGLGLVARGVTGHCVLNQALSRDTARALSGERKHLDVSRSIAIVAPPERLQELLRSPQSWLSGDRVSVEQSSPDQITFTGRLGWLGRRTLELEILPLGSQGVIWRTAPDAWLRVEARAELSDAASRRGTEVRVRLHASPKPGIGAGLIRRAVEKIAERMVGVALHRLKQLAETGEITSAGPRKRTRPLRAESAT